MTWTAHVVKSRELKSRKAKSREPKSTSPFSPKGIGGWSSKSREPEPREPYMLYIFYILYIFNIETLLHNFGSSLPLFHTLPFSQVSLLRRPKAAEEAKPTPHFNATDFQRTPEGLGTYAPQSQRSTVSTHPKIMVLSQGSWFIRKGV